MNVKDAAYHTVHDYPGGAAALAVRMGKKSGQVLTNKVNPNNEDHHLRLDEAVAMMSLTGDHRIIEAMAGELGGVFAMLPYGEVTGENLFGLILSATAQNGDICQAFNQAMQDGRIDAREEKAILGMIDTLTSHLYALRQCVLKHTQSNKWTTE